MKDSDLGWSEIEVEDEHAPLHPHTKLLLPPTIRGVVMGMSAFCVGSKIKKPAGYDPNKVLCGALCMVFDSESIGFAGALARVFQRVAVINFSKSYTDYENPVRVNVLSPALVSITAPHDIVMADHTLEISVESRIIDQQSASDRFFDFVEEIWQPGTIYHMRQNEIKKARGEPASGYDPRLFHTDYIVIGPTCSDLQRDTVNMFLDREQTRFISRDAVLLTITPMEISGVKVNKEQFCLDYEPYMFKKLARRVPDPNINNGVPSWPPVEDGKPLPQVEQGGERQRNRHSSAVDDMGEETCLVVVEKEKEGEGLSSAADFKWMLKAGDKRSLIHLSLFTFENSKLIQADAKASTTQQTPSTETSATEQTPSTETSATQDQTPTTETSATQQTPSTETSATQDQTPTTETSATQQTPSTVTSATQDQTPSTETSHVQGEIGDTQQETELPPDHDDTGTDHS